jgi:penicillin-binding protein 1A
MEQEYFVGGTQPLDRCNCHVKYKICTVSGKPATEKCPEDDVEEKVYLIKEETADTRDKEYILSDKAASDRCTAHTGQN